MNERFIDAVMVVSLIAVVVLEFAVNANEFSHYQVLMGLIIGFSVGFKLSAVHSGSVSRKAIEMAKAKEERLCDVEDEKSRSEKAYEVELKRKDKLLKTLTINLEDRDREIKELIRRMQD